MDFELAEEFRMLRDLVEKFVEEQLFPLEPAVLAREASGQGTFISPAEREELNRVYGGWMPRKT